MNLVRTLARQELADNPAPPRDVVAGALRAGRRRLLRRRLAGAGGAVMVMIAAAVGVPALLDGGGSAAVTPVGSVAVQPVPGHGPPVPATPAGVLRVLAYLVPEVAYGHHSGMWIEGQVAVTTSLTTGLGEGELGLNVSFGTGRYATLDTTGACDLYFTSSCEYRNFDDGTKLQVLHIPGNCTEATTVTAMRPDDVSVTLFVSTCLNSRTPAPAQLTTDQAIAIVMNPAFDRYLASSVVADGQAQFPDLPQVES
jgi:hypothetical protein